MKPMILLSALAAATFRPEAIEYEMKADATSSDFYFTRNPYRGPSTGIPFHGRTIGTRKAMREAKRNRNFNARASKRR